MRLSRPALGRIGEDLAVDHLRKAGYRIVERNVRTRYGEIDIIAEERGCLVFVEVRAMASNLMAPEESVGPRKQRQVGSLAIRYLQERGKLESDWRVDVIAIEMGEAGKASRLEHYVSALET